MLAMISNKLYICVSIHLSIIVTFVKIYQIFIKTIERNEKKKKKKKTTNKIKKKKKKKNL